MIVQMRSFDSTFEKGYRKSTEAFNDFVRTHKDTTIQGAMWFKMDETKTISLVVTYTLGKPEKPMVIPYTPTPRGHN